VFPERLFCPKPASIKALMLSQGERNRHTDSVRRREREQESRKKDREVFILSAGSLELYFVK